MSISFNEVQIDTGAEESIINIVNTLDREKGKLIHLKDNFDHYNLNH